MKAAITNAVMTYAQAAGAWRDRDTVTIERLNREAHALANRATVAEGALELIRMELGLPDGASPLTIVDAIRGLR